MGTIEASVDKGVSKFEAEIETWGAKLREVVAKLEAAGRETKSDARAHLEEVQAKLAVARAKLDEAKRAGGDRWDKFKAGVESSWKELESAFRKAAT